LQRPIHETKESSRKIPKRDERNKREMVLGSRPFRRDIIIQKHPIQTEFSTGSIVDAYNKEPTSPYPCAGHGYIRKRGWDDDKTGTRLVA